MKNISDSNDILPALKARQNVFITGSAGSGKTYFASNFSELVPYSVLTATTGVAALNLGGETVHRFLGLGITSRPEEAGKVIGRWEKIKKSSSPWDIAKWSLAQSLQTLIIDECSMMRRDTFELIDVVLSHIKNNPLAFGGVQICLVGDFAQLPPVVSTSDAFMYPDLKDPYCFQSNLWNQANFQSFNLTTNYRQGEGLFLNALEKIRRGEITSEIEDMFNSRVGVDLKIPMSPVKLFSHKVDVNKENMDCLQKLPGEKYVSEAEFEGKDYDVGILSKECPAEKSLYFCKGAQVMMLTNDPAGRWVNGTLGIIRSCSPLCVQLSNNLTVSVAMHGWERCVPYLDKSNGTIRSQTVAKMRQYPIALAWSSSIHKSQGLSLDYVEADLSKCFSPGQAYVALSRVKTLEGLKLVGWNKKSIFADERVKKFYGTYNSNSIL
ncbi:MAG: AAA family ATPase [Patescibacteria group bacterium]